MATHQAFKQITDVCYTLCVLGIPLNGLSWLFGDTKVVIMSSTIPNALLYHKVYEMVTVNAVCFEFILVPTILWIS